MSIDFYIQLYMLKEKDYILLPLSSQFWTSSTRVHTNNCHVSFHNYHIIYKHITISSLCLRQLITYRTLIHLSLASFYIYGPYSHIYMMRSCLFQLGFAAITARGVRICPAKSGCSVAPSCCINLA